MQTSKYNARLSGCCLQRRKPDPETTIRLSTQHTWVSSCTGCFQGWRKPDPETTLRMSTHTAHLSIKLYRLFSRLKKTWSWNNAQNVYPHSTLEYQVLQAVFKVGRGSWVFLWKASWSQKIHVWVEGNVCNIPCRSSVHLSYCVAERTEPTTCWWRKPRSSPWPAHTLPSNVVTLSMLDFR